jgi:hypothetical protein
MPTPPRSVKPASGMNTLMDHIRLAYRAKIEQVKEKNQQPGAREQLVQLLTFDGFIQFANKYLSEINPPVESFAASVGLGLRLADSTRVLLSNHAAQTAPAGGMAPDNDNYLITRGDQTTTTED